MKDKDIKMIISIVRKELHSDNRNVMNFIQSNMNHQCFRWPEPSEWALIQTGIDPQSDASVFLALAEQFVNQKNKR